MVRVDRRRRRLKEEVPLELVSDRTGSGRTVGLPPAAMRVYRLEECAKFLATASLDGVPNVALIVSQTPVDDGKVIFGEFMMVKTQANLEANPRIASIAISEKLEMGGFKGDVTEWSSSGEYIDIINSIPFFRYNAYAGIHNVATCVIRELLPLPAKVPMLRVGAEYLAMRTMGRIGHARSVGGVVTPAAIRRRFDGIMSVKVLAYVGSDGYPSVVPVFGVRFRTPGELRFKLSGYNRPAWDLEPGARVALNVLTLDLVTYQVKGTLMRFDSAMGLRTGVVRIDEAYSCVPPLVGERVA